MEKDLSSNFEFDIIIVGGGHAGIEAAFIASQFGLNIGLISLPEVEIASAPCNPSIGGVAKGQVVKEIDALGGLMGILADKCGIQYRTLNSSKGFAVQSTRVQIDKDKYAVEAEKALTERDNISIIRDKVLKIVKNEEKFLIQGQNHQYFAPKVIMTTGTFLNGRLHCGPEQTQGGRIELPASGGLLDIFSLIKTNPLRFKTGT
jgi:tRNA uridine 5-carboxymethylaminomethyl modification enzyme